MADISISTGTQTTRKNVIRPAVSAVMNAAIELFTAIREKHAERRNEKILSSLPSDILKDIGYPVANSRKN